MKNLILLFTFILSHRILCSQNLFDTIECVIAYRIDTGKYSFSYISDNGDQIYYESKCVLMRNNNFTDTGFSNLSDSIILQYLKDENHFKLFSKSYKRKKSKNQKEFFKDFNGYDFYLIKVSIIISGFKPTPRLNYLWPSNSKNLSYIKQGTIGEVVKVLEIAPHKVQNLYFSKWN